MAFVKVDGRFVHVRITPGKRPGDPVTLSSNDERAIREFTRALDMKTKPQIPPQPKG